MRVEFHTGTNRKRRPLPAPDQVVPPKKIPTTERDLRELARIPEEASRALDFELARLISPHGAGVSVILSNLN